VREDTILLNIVLHSVGESVRGIAMQPPPLACLRKHAGGGRGRASTVIPLQLRLVLISSPEISGVVDPTQKSSASRADSATILGTFVKTPASWPEQEHKAEALSARALKLSLHR